MKKLFLTVVFTLSLLPLCGQINSFLVDSLIRVMLPESSEVGICVYDLTAQKSLYSYRAEKLSRPASTLKLLTAITALSRPDGNKPFRTEVWHDGGIANDTLNGNLYVVGGFDPEFDAADLDALIEKVSTFPFSVIKGQVLGDVSMKDSLYWGSGWAWDDNPADYQPYLSPLMLCKGAVQLLLIPAKKRGDAAMISCQPFSSYYTLTNHTQTHTPSAGRLVCSRDWLDNKNNLVASGNVSYTLKKSVNIHNSADFFMHTFVERLQQKGIVVPSQYAFAELPADGTELVQMAVQSTSVQQVLTQLMKESDNLNAEALLYRMGAQATNKKRVSAEDGTAQVMRLIQYLGHDPKSYKVVDGSGLSNYNYLTPTLLVDFLKYAYTQKEIFGSLYQSLPIAGVDGTLKNRMKGTSAFRNVHAKTGSLTGSSALAGYLRLKNGHEVAFAIMNQNILSASKARAFQDKICEVIIGN